jgi:hypothetical protein
MGNNDLDFWWIIVLLFILLVPLFLIFVCI